MSDFSGLPPDMRDAEEVLTRLRGVTSAHIVLDASGQIAEVHIIASGERHPKQIVRDVESALFAKLGTRVDHRKISVALLEGKSPEPAMEPERPRVVFPTPRPRAPLREPEMERESQPATDPAVLPRLRFAGMNLQVSGKGCHATVEIVHGRVSTVGDSESPGVGKGALRSLAEATLRAVMHCYENGPAFALDEVAFMTVGQREVVVVSVNYFLGREAIHLLGSTYVGLDPQQAVVFATLDAVNRFSGRLKERRFVEYEVGPSPVKV